MKRYAGEEFLNKIYQDLVNSDIVKHTGLGGNKNEDVHIYMDRLDRITSDALKHDKISLLKKMYYDKYVIKKENIPESYFEHQEKIALDRGYGHIHYDERTKIEEINSIINEQKEALDSWIDYFSCPDTNMYPTWFKYFCFQGMLKIGYFDKKENKFTKRTSSTVKPFVEINREALALVYDELVKVLDKEKIDDTEMELLLKSGSFSKIYAYAIKKLDSYRISKIDSDKGKWQKYNRGSNPEILFNDIHGKGTGWCTAGGLETAKKHLDGGDFYVYYTKDEQGNFSQPRIAIRMERGRIAEIRGIAEDQNLEANMENVVEEKLEEFPDKDEYKKKVNNMKKLTYIYNKWQSKEELTIDDLKFLYEVDGKIIGFGFKDDPRIKEIIDTRNKSKDLVNIFDCKKNQISFTEYDATKVNIIFHYGDLLNLSGISYVANKLNLPQNISGSLALSSLKSMDGVTLPNKIGCDLRLNSIENGEGLSLPTLIGRDLYLLSLTNINGLIIPDELDCNLFCPLANDDLNVLKQMCKNNDKKLIKRK